MCPVITPASAPKPVTEVASDTTESVLSFVKSKPAFSVALISFSAMNDLLLVG
jgi:hypothetical protein